MINNHAFRTEHRRSVAPVCSEALDIFVRLYGVEAGNHVLKIMATGGVYIGGGIAPRILDQHTALYGAAVYAGRKLNAPNQP